MTDRPPRLPGAPPELDGVARRYCEIRGTFGQVTGFIAAWKGVKPVLDDWIPRERLPAFEDLVRSVGLRMTVDCLFRFIEDETETRGVVGGDRLNTTRAVGLPPWSAADGVLAHVFVSRSERWLGQARDRGWYALVMDGRVVEKPWIDHYEFGEALGYPTCCRRFFAFHNEWNTNNSLYQAWRATRTTALASCNTLMKHSGFSYGWHLPCAFDCAETRARAAAVRAAVSEESGELAAYVDRVLCRPFLVLSEWEAFGFDGELDEAGRLAYRRLFVVPTNRPDETLWRALRDGDGLEVTGDVLRISRAGRVISTATAAVDRFGPQIPVIADFRPEPKGGA